MYEITVYLKDKKDKNYEEEIAVFVSAETLLALKWGEDVDCDLHQKYWNKLCDIISKRPSLPCDWYIDELIFH